ATFAWAWTNYVYTLNPASSNALVVIRLILFFVVVLNTVFWVFAHNYPSVKQTISRTKLIVVFCASAIVSATILSPYVFTSVTVINGQSNPNPSLLILLFMLHAIYTIGSGLRSLIKKQKLATGQTRSQIKFIFVASVLNSVVVPITNFVVTLLFHTAFFARVSPIYSLAFAGIIAYAIVAQKLFDVRAVVARSVAYVLLVASMAFVYSVALFGIVNVVFSGGSRETLRQILSVVLVFPFALSFQHIKNFFDRITTRIFYNDNYDSQAVLNRLGRNVAAETHLEKVVTSTRLVLSTAIKSSFVEFLLFNEHGPYLEESVNPELESVVATLLPLLKDQNRTIMTVEAGGVNQSVKQVLASKRVSVSVRLKSQNETLGFILFGDKKNGDIYSSQDIKLLRIVASELAIAVQNALQFEQIEQFNQTLQQKVEDATRKLRETNQKLKKLDETKDDFISMASHQLRTPLTSVKGYVSMVLDGDAGKINAQQKQLLNQSFVSSQRMVSLIADLLNVSRLKTGKFMIESKPTNLVEVVEGELAQLTETAKGRGLQLKFDHPKHFPDLMLDETKIRQVIMNFTDNAIYYTPKGGVITVTLVDKPSSVELTVADNGIGVPAHERHHLFTKFYRAGNARKARPDGTGLGLFMAKKVIMASGGALIFDSIEGKGSTFGFSFPKHKLLVK
ncbi:MAG: ATP-binding protein, partial [Candidatus Saccharimonadales bacterium]